jgi:gamma-glutamyl-gamma-aminobutyrate hydrolase PuuD
MKKILVTQRIADNPTYVERRDALAHDWSVLFAAYDILPILVPNAATDPSAYLSLDATGLLLTGGDDMGPASQPTLRDATEFRLLEGALARKLPVFGVCRGLQVLNRHFGGQVETSLPEPHVGDHDVTLDNGAVQRVNSFHNQGVVTAGLSPQLRAFAQTGGGVIEALRHPSLPVTAVQWHPERPSPSAVLDRSLIEEWLNQCA